MAWLSAVVVIHLICTEAWDWSEKNKTDFSRTTQLLQKASAILIEDDAPYMWSVTYSPEKMAEAKKLVEMVQEIGWKPRRVVIEDKARSIVGARPKSPAGSFGHHILFDYVACLSLIHHGQSYLAVEPLREISTNYPNWPDGKLALAEALRRSWKLDESMAINRELSHIAPLSAAWNMGRIELQLGRNYQALEHYSFLCMRIPADPRLLARKGAAMSTLGYKISALKLAHEALAIEPGNPHGCGLLGLLYSNECRHEEACREFEKAMNQGVIPEGTQALYMATLFGLNRVDEALKVTKIMRGRWPNDPAIIRFEARCYRVLNQEIEAQLCDSQLKRLSQANSDGNSPFKILENASDIKEELRINDSFFSRNPFPMFYLAPPDPVSTPVIRSDSD